MADTLVIHNPLAGRGRAQRCRPAIEEGLREAGVEFEAVTTGAPLDAMAIAMEAAEEYASIVALGGDGTVHEIANGLMRASAEGETAAMGVVPLGNGDDFAKMIPPEMSIGGRSLDWRTAVQKIARRQTRLFDVGRIVGDGMIPEWGVGPHYFVNSMDLGFPAQGALNMKTIPKSLTGFSAYFATAVKTIISCFPLHLRIKIDDQPSIEQSTTMVAIMNGRCFANSFWVCPDARADDGQLDVMVTQEVGRLKIMRMIPRFMRGTHVGDQALRMHHAQRIVIDSQEPLAVEADGEIPYLRAHHLEVDVLHRKLRVIV